VPNAPSTLDSELTLPPALGGQREPALPALMIAWSADEPSRVGEIAQLEMENAAYLFGRGAPASGPAAMRLSFCRQRPGETIPTPPIESPSISREQLRIVRKGRALHVERIGRCPLIVRGEKVDRAVLEPGDWLLLRAQLLMLCTERPRTIAPLRDFPREALRDFGEPDALGLIGESPAIMRLRDAIAFHAKAGAHALVLGPSGAGKELVARALHRLSSRSGGPFVARSAATLPQGLVDAELFGNAKNYPNPGMAERPGLVGAAEGGTLFLDEIGELPASLHANLLRVLDGHGEYHRLGDARAQHANLRLIGATNRAPEALKHDLLARLPLRLEVSGLDARRDDIPLLVRHVLRRALLDTPALVSRFKGTSGEIDVAPELLEHLLGHAYTTHVRELEGLLWRAMSESTGAVVELPPAMAERPNAKVAEGAPPQAVDAEERAPTGPLQPEGAPMELTEERMRALSAQHGGNLAEVARALGLPSRYVLYRLLRKHGIDIVALRETER
jgi:DNA-binding NtrC family response regulator